MGLIVGAADPSSWALVLGGLLYMHPSPLFEHVSQGCLPSHLTFRARQGSQAVVIRVRRLCLPTIGMSVLEVQVEKWHIPFKPISILKFSAPVHYRI